MMTYLERIEEINDKIRSALNHDDDINISMIKERQEIIDSVTIRDEHDWDDEMIKEEIGGDTL